MEYRGFRADTHFVAVGDVVMLDPGDDDSEPFIGWVRRLFDAPDGQMMMSAQWFFRPGDCREAFEDMSKSTSPAAAILAKAKDNEIYASKQVRACRAETSRVVSPLTAGALVWHGTDYRCSPSPPPRRRLRTTPSRAT